MTREQRALLELQVATWEGKDLLTVDAIRAALARLDAAERVVEALRWYAEPGNTKAEWYSPEWAAGASVPKWRPIDDDEGELARAALAEKKGTP